MHIINFDSEIDRSGLIHNNLAVVFPGFNKTKWQFIDNKQFLNAVSGLLVVFVINIVIYMTRFTERKFIKNHFKCFAAVYKRNHFVNTVFAAAVVLRIMCVDTYANISFGMNFIAHILIISFF